MNSQLFNQMKASTDGKLLASALAKVYIRCVNEPYSTLEGVKLAEENLQLTGPSEDSKIAGILSMIVFAWLHKL